MGKVADPLRSFVAGSFVYDLKAGGHFYEPSLREVATELRQESVKAMSRRVDQSHESSPMRQENETTITDELRKWASDNTVRDMVLTSYPEQHAVHGTLEQLIAIADRIDEQFARICWQHEAVLQSTIDEQDGRITKLVRQRDELRAKLDSVTQEYLAMRSALDTSNTALRQILAERDEARKMLDAIRGILDGS